MGFPKPIEIDLIRHGLFLSRRETGSKAILLPRRAAVVDLIEGKLSLLSVLRPAQNGLPELLGDCLYVLNYVWIQACHNVLPTAYRLTTGFAALTSLGAQTSRDRKSLRGAFFQFHRMQLSVDDGLPVKDTRSPWRSPAKLPIR